MIQVTIVYYTTDDEQDEGWAVRTLLNKARHHTLAVHLDRTESVDPNESLCDHCAKQLPLGRPWGPMVTAAGLPREGGS